MNEHQVQFGVATSSQHETPLKEDFQLVAKIQEIKRVNKPQDALKMIISEFLSLGSGVTALYEMGLNRQALINQIRWYYNQGRFTDGIKLVSDICDLLVFGLDNIEVFKKYIELLKLFNFKFFRLAINWSKCINPEGALDPEEISNYAERVGLLIDAEIEPIITFSHFETRGYDINSEGFEKLFVRFAANILDRFIPLGVKYFLAFNEPAVHSGGINLGFWGPGKIGIANFINHFKTLKTFGKLSKMFYIQAHRRDPNVKIIANFNVALFDPGIAPTAIDKFAVRISDYIDKNLQIDPYTFTQEDENQLYPFVEKGKKAYDTIALNPYKIYDYSKVNQIKRWLVKSFVAGTEMFNNPSFTQEEFNVEDLIESTSNPDFSDSELTRTGAHGEILYPKAIGKVAREMSRRFDIKDMVVTESGADIDSHSTQGIVDKIWYIKNSKREIEKLAEDNISVPFALFWTMFRMWEILGPDGGGVGNWDFGILGEPVSKDELIKDIMLEADFNIYQARALADKFIRGGNMPVKIYKHMIDNLGKIFANSKITVQQMVNALVTKNNEDILINIIQLAYLKKYYENKQDEESIAYICQMQQELKYRIDNEDTAQLEAVEA